MRMWNCSTDDRLRDDETCQKSATAAATAGECWYLSVQTPVGCCLAPVAAAAAARDANGRRALYEYRRR